MKSRSQELLDKSLAAMISAIEIYNKPDFKYREETFSVLAINAWELLLKAYWLKINKNKPRSLYVTEKKIRPNGQPYKHPKVKMTASGNPFTHSLDYLAKKLKERKLLDEAAHKNIIALCEIRDSAVHFYNRGSAFVTRLQEIGSASVRNYVHASQEWFGVDFEQYNFYLMPLAFVQNDDQPTSLVLNKEERNIAKFISSLDTESDPNKKYSVSLNIDLNFRRSKVASAIEVQITNDPSATKVQLTEEQIKNKYPLSYKSLSDECAQRYSDFKQNSQYHKIRKPLKSDKRYCHVRRLDPGNLKSPKQDWYSRAVFNVLDKYYTKRD